MRSEGSPSRLRENRSACTTGYGAGSQRSEVFFAGAKKHFRAKVAYKRTSIWFTDHAGCGGGVLRVHYRAAFGLAQIAKQSGGPRAQGFTAPAARAKRFEHGSAGNARHAGRERAVSAAGVVAAIRTGTR